jgi:hypothetical protein
MTSNIICILCNMSNETDEDEVDRTRRKSETRNLHKFRVHDIGYCLRGGTVI